MGNSQLFECNGPLNGLEIPIAWPGWDYLDRCHYIQSLDLAGDLLSASEILRSSGLPESESESEPEPEPESEPEPTGLDDLPPGRVGGWAGEYDHY